MTTAIAVSVNERDLLRHELMIESGCFGDLETLVAGDRESGRCELRLRRRAAIVMQLLDDLGGAESILARRST